MASQKFLTDIDLDGNQLINVLAENLATDPVTPAISRFWYNTTENTIKYYNGTSVKTVGNINGSLIANQIAVGNGTDTIQGTNNFTFDGSTFNLVQTAKTSGTTPLFILTGASHTNQIGGAELIDVNINLARTVEFQGGNIPEQKAIFIQSPTYSFLSPSVITNTATVVISGSPIAGINASIDNGFAFWIKSGGMRYDVGSDATGDTYYRDSNNRFQRLPIGTPSQVLKSSLSGIPEWSDSNTIVAGSDKQVQFNDNGVLAGASQMYWDKTLNYFQVGIDSTQITTELFLNLKANSNTYRSIGVQNTNNGNLSAGDFTAVADNGNINVNFASFGINSSGYNDPAYPIQGANSGYAFVNGGNMVIGTQTAHDIIFHTGGTNLSDRAMIIRGASPQKGYVGFLEGTSSNPTLLGKIHIVNETDSVGTFFADRYSTTNSAFLTLRRARGTVASPTAVQNNDSLGGIGFRGYGATQFSTNTRANILARANQTWTDTAQGTNLEFATTTTGGTTSVITTMTSTSLNSASTTYSLFNTVSTTISFAGATTTLNIGGTPNGSITANFFTNATTNGNTKTINLGTGGNNGSVFALNIGSTVATNNITLNLTSSATGDIWYRNSSGYLTRLPIGSTGKVLTVSGGLPVWGFAVAVTEVASTSTLTIDIDSTDTSIITALATNLTIAIPSGTPTQGRKLIIRIKDNGTARTITWNAIFRAIGVTLPTTTVLGKTLYVGCIYNSTDVKWDVVAVSQEA